MQIVGESRQNAFSWAKSNITSLNRLRSENPAGDVWTIHARKGEEIEKLTSSVRNCTLAILAQRKLASRHLLESALEEAVAAEAVCFRVQG